MPQIQLFLKFLYNNKAINIELLKTLVENSHHYQSVDNLLKELIGSGEIDINRAKALRESFYQLLSSKNSGESDLSTHQKITIPKKIDKYEVRQKLGRGGMGEVYLVYDTILQREAALKVVISQGKISPERNKRMIREARAMSLLRHPNIIEIYDVRCEGNMLYIVMPVVVGESLKDFMRRGKLPIKLILHLLIQVGNAIHYAHEQGIIHRDLKPANIMIDKNQKPIIMDFGLARFEEEGGERITQSNMIIGSYHYMSPEQAEGHKDIDKLSDLYSFGVILYELLTESVPFSGSSPVRILHQIFYDPPPHPRSICPDIPQALETICLKALEKEKKDRYESMREMVAELKAFLHMPKQEGMINKHQKTAGKINKISRSAARARKTKETNSFFQSQTFLYAAMSLCVFLMAMVIIMLRTNNEPEANELETRASKQKPKKKKVLQSNHKLPLLYKAAPFNAVNGFYKLRKPSKIFPNSLEITGQIHTPIIYQKDLCYFGTDLGVCAVDLYDFSLKWFVKIIGGVQELYLVGDKLYGKGLISYQNRLDYHTIFVVSKSQRKLEWQKKYRHGDIVALDKDKLYLRTNGFSILDLSTDQESLLLDKKIAHFTLSEKKVYVSTQKGSILALDAKGKIYWQHQVKKKEQVELISYRNDCLFYRIGTDLFVLNDKGEIKHRIPHRVSSHFEYDKLGNKLFWIENQNIHALDVTRGVILWKIPTAGNSWQMICKENNVYYRDKAGVFCLDIKNGKQIWQWPYKSSIEATHLHVTDNGRIYFTMYWPGGGAMVQNTVNYLYALDRASGQLQWVFRPPNEQLQNQKFFSPFFVSEQVSTPDDQMHFAVGSFFFSLPRRISPEKDPQRFKKVMPTQINSGLYAEILPSPKRMNIIKGLPYNPRYECFMLTSPGSPLIVEFSLAKIPNKLLINVADIVAVNTNLSEDRADVEIDLNNTFIRRYQRTNAVLQGQTFLIGKNSLRSTNRITIRIQPSSTNIYWISNVQVWIPFQ